MSQIKALQDHWLEMRLKDMIRRDAYEAALRRELATLRARKRYGDDFPDYDEFSMNWGKWLLCLKKDDNPIGKMRYSREIRINAARWRKDRTEGNWGNYLRREKEVRANDYTTNP